MFGESTSESPRLPSPWRSLARSSLESPSPLSLRTPSSSPRPPPTPTSQPPAPPALRRQLSVQRLFGDDEFAVLTLEEDDFDDLDGALLDSSSPPIAGLDPEVDKSGHIEYKLKLPSPSPVRLAKLQTQLKWRLVEGGGMALYEIGLLDDGTLVGLGEDEMNESLQTLGLMLRGLGGGEIRVGRVVRLGGGAGRRREGGGDANASSGDDADPPPSPSPSSLFESFVVEGEEPEAYDPGEPLPLLGTLPIAIPTSSTTSSSSASSSTKGQQKQPRPYPERTPEERAALKRSKRDARRYRDADGNDIPRPASEARPPREERVVVVPKPPKPKPPKPVKEQVGGGNGGEAMAASRKPKMAVEGEVRFVVEAVVLTKGGMRRAEEREEEREGEPEEGEEGWRYLDFDWMQDAKGFVR